MKKLVPFLFILVLLVPGLACSLSAGKDQTPAAEVNDVEETTPIATGSAQVAEEPAQTPSVVLSNGLEPGWYLYTNANDVRDLVVYDGVVYAATLGGMVAWGLDSAYSMKYTPMDGMGNVSANAITYCEIPEPRILVGTLTGISEYDPATGLWEQTLVFPEDSYVTTSKINRLYCDQANNRLLIGYYGLGVLDLTTGEYSRYREEEGLLWDSVNDITVNGSDIWIANGYKGISKISNDVITNYSEAEGLPEDSAYALAFGEDGTLWIGTSGGMVSFKSGQWKYYDSSSPASLYNINEIRVTSDGKIWAATLPFGTGRLCQFDPVEGTCVVDMLDAEGQGIYALALTDEDVPVYATNKGVYVVENGVATALKTEDKLKSNFVDSFASTTDGQLWVGTDAGIQMVDLYDIDGEWKTFNDSEFPDMGGNWGRAIAVGPDGSVWMAITNGSASLYRDGTWTNFEDIYSYDAVAVDNEGRAWFGDDSYGVRVLNPDGSQAFTFTTDNGLPGNNVQAIVIDLSGRVWIGTDKGLAKVENDTLEIVFGTESTELPNPYIRALAIHPDGDLVIGTYTGIAKYDGNQVELLIDVMNSDYNNARLTTLAVTPDGEVWAGTDVGLLRSENGTWRMLTTKDGLLTNYISALHVDPFGAVWVGGGGSNYDGGGMVQIVP